MPLTFANGPECPTVPGVDVPKDILAYLQNSKINLLDRFKESFKRANKNSEDDEELYLYEEICTFYEDEGSLLEKSSITPEIIGKNFSNEAYLEAIVCMADHLSPESRVSWLKSYNLKRMASKIIKHS